MGSHEESFARLGSTLTNCFSRPSKDQDDKWHTTTVFDVLERISVSLSSIDQTLARIAEEGIPPYRAASAPDEIPEEDSILFASPMVILGILYKASPAATVGLAGEPSEIRDLANAIGRPILEVNVAIAGLIACGFAETVDDGRVRITPIGRKAHELGLSYLFPKKAQK